MSKLRVIFLCVLFFSVPRIPPSFPPGQVVFEGPIYPVFFPVIQEQFLIFRYGLDCVCMSTTKITLTGNTNLHDTLCGAHH